MNRIAVLAATVATAVFSTGAAHAGTGLPGLDMIDLLPNLGFSAVALIPTPEPATLGVLGVAVAGLIASRRRK